MKATVFVNPTLEDGQRIVLGEGPIVFQDHLISTDARRALLRRTNLQTGETQNTKVGDPILGCAAPTEDAQLLVALTAGIFKYHPETQDLSPLAHPEENRGAYYNDGKIGPDGAFYVGGMTGKEGEGRLLRISPEGAYTEPLEDAPPLTTPNGLHWFPTEDPGVWDFYYVCSHYPAIQRYKHHLPTGKMARQDDLVRLPKAEFGYLDGMTGSANHLLFLALYESREYGCLAIDSLTGEILERIETNAPQTTSVALHGDTLFITSASQHYESKDFEKHPNAGAIFKAQLSEANHPRVREARSTEPFQLKCPTSKS